MTNLVLSLVFLLSSFGADYVHEFHVSKCAIEYNSNAQELQISVNIFIDDLEVALKEDGAENLFIGTEKETLEADEYIIKYLRKTFQVQVNASKKYKLEFVGKEVSEDLNSIWCYLAISDLKTLKRIFVKNEILLEIFDDQKNIVSIIGPKEEKASFMGTRSNNEKTIIY